MIYVTVSVALDRPLSFVIFYLMSLLSCPLSQPVRDICTLCDALTCMLYVKTASL